MKSISASLELKPEYLTVSSHCRATEAGQQETCKRICDPAFRWYKQGNFRLIEALMFLSSYRREDAIVRILQRCSLRSE
jgi:hypothetical protein